MKRKIVFLIVMLGLVAGAYIGYKYLYKDHRNIGNEVSVLEVKADDLQLMFQNNKTIAVLNKTITVGGTITQIEGNSITLDDKVQCSFENKPEQLAIGDKVRVKGRCIGYDDLFEIVKLDQSTIYSRQ
jgi:tRNA_anti-like